MIMCRVITRFQRYPYKRRQFREIKTRQALISIEKITLPGTMHAGAILSLGKMPV
jgi:hypothetical protein